ncbi:hypothetical protein ACFL35_17505 [Candidatus Riflebacteria bacterium]
MLKIVCDADGLIKSNKAGILELLADESQLFVGPEVIREAVSDGKASGYPDAIEIERLSGKFQQPGKPESNLNPEYLEIAAYLGKGEREVLGLYLAFQADRILSDDQEFLTLLIALNISFLTPASAILLLLEKGRLGKGEALNALERIQPYIEPGLFRASVQSIHEYF